jgi:hypothetical protein
MSIDLSLVHDVAIDRNVAASVSVVRAIRLEESEFPTSD